MQQVPLICLFVALLVLSVFSGEDPDVNRDFVQIVQAKGYPCSVYYATTEDGYVLTLFRIPYGINGPTPGPRRPVLLQHGLMDYAFTWIFNMPNESLSYVLADAGYDVWMGNNRGTKYGMSNIHYSPDQHEFWEFSYDEMGQYDVPAMIDYVLSTTGFSNLTYIGHSEGTTQMFAALVNPAVASSVVSKLNYYVGLGPVTMVGHLTEVVFRALADIYADDFTFLFGDNSFLPAFNGTLKYLFGEFCYTCETCCVDGIELITGEHQSTFNDSRIPVMATHEPGGTSVQNMQHWGQAVRTGLFEFYDYGEQGNMQHYHQPTPPPYNMSLFPPQLKVALFSGGQDELADPVDTQALVAQLPKQNLFWRQIADYGHVDFVWAVDARTVVYETILQLIQ